MHQIIFLYVSIDTELKKETHKSFYNKYGLYILTIQYLEV